MLAQVARQVANGEYEIQEFGNEGIFGREAGFAELASGTVFWIGPAPRGDERGDASEIGLTEAEHLADVANG